MFDKLAKDLKKQAARFAASPCATVLYAGNDYSAVNNLDQAVRHVILHTEKQTIHMTDGGQWLINALRKQVVVGGQLKTVAETLSKDQQLYLWCQASVYFVKGSSGTVDALVGDFAPAGMSWFGSVFFTHELDAANKNSRIATINSSKSYGNGGAICLSYDSSPLGRAYFNLTPNPLVTELGGVCSGSIIDTTFFGCKGGWQGGAVSANGRGMQLTFQHCTFLSCEGGGRSQAGRQRGSGFKWWRPQSATPFSIERRHHHSRPMYYPRLLGYWKRRRALQHGRRRYQRPERHGRPKV